MTTAEGPRKVYVEPTNACNLACRTCVRHSWDEPEGFMEWATFEAVVDGLGGRRDRRPSWASASLCCIRGSSTWCGWPRTAACARRSPPTRCCWTTRWRPASLEAGLDQLVVSIDGASAEAFGRVRSGASLERVVENVRRLHDCRGANYGPGTRIGVEFVAMRSNIDELPGLGRLAAQLGATFIIVSNVLAYTADLLGRDALRPARELAERRGDDGGAALAAARVRLGRAARRGAR